MLGLTTAGAGRLKSLRRSKLYDLLAALPLIAWCAFWGARMLPTLVQQMMLVKLFIQTDPTVLPIDLVLSLISKLACLAYLAFLIVFFAIRYIPQASAPGLHPRFAALAGTYLSASIVLLPFQELSPVLYMISLLLRHPLYLGEMTAMLGIAMQYSAPMGSVAFCTTMHLPVLAHKKRGTAAVGSFS